MNNKSFVADISITKFGGTTRTRVSGNSIMMNNASSDFAVLNYLKSKYGPDVTINNIQWK